MMPPPAVATAGSFVAFGIDNLTDATNTETVTFVDVRDLSKPDAPVVAILAAQPSPLNTGATSKVVKVVAKPDGAVAWISCTPGSTTDEDLATGRRARCQRPGTYARVYLHNVGMGLHGSRRVDHGASIDPLSLTLRGSVLTWRHGRQPRRATLN